VRLYALLLLGVLLLGCAEPDRRVTAATADGGFALSLAASRNWMRPGDSLPVQVRVERLSGPAEEREDTVEFVCNRGVGSPAALTVSLAGADSPGVIFTGWVTFTAASEITSSDQGEVHALFRDAVATLKIRIVPAGVEEERSEEEF
jgi:hypothetical protein